jgi:SagB-type dehydrogenase family enzyme
MFPFEDGTSLSLLYHLNSEPWGNVDAYQSVAYEVEYKQVTPSSPPLSLPKPSESDITRLASQRYSCRAYEPKTLPLSTLSSLLWGSYGITRTDETLLGGSLALMRPVPSAGGLFPLEVYVATQRVQDLPDGLHHYNVRNHTLEPLSDEPIFKALQPHLFMFQAIEHANAIVFLAAVFKRTQKKYGPRGYRYILLEAGHVAQNLCLLAVEQELGSLCMGGYTDGELNRVLGLNPLEEGVVYSVAVGWPAAELRKNGSSHGEPEE